MLFDGPVNAKYMQKHEQTWTLITSLAQIKLSMSDLNRLVCTQWKKNSWKIVSLSDWQKNKCNHCFSWIFFGNFLNRKNLKQNLKRNFFHFVVNTVFMNNFLGFSTHCKSPTAGFLISNVCYHTLNHTAEFSSSFTNFIRLAYSLC